MLCAMQVVALLAERGFTDLSLVACDPWSVHAAPQQLQGRRLIQLFMYGRSRSGTAAALSAAAAAVGAAWALTITGSCGVDSTGNTTLAHAVALSWSYTCTNAYAL
jgi:hypothetical protein